MPASLLPRPLPSPPTMTSLKRKANEDDLRDESADEPRKLPAFGTSRPAIRQTRAALAASKSAGSLPKPLTRPLASQPPPARRTARGTSAPPSSAPARPAPITRSAATRTTGNNRVVSGPSRPAVNAKGVGLGEKRLHELENQQARLAADMEAERNKVAELQTSHINLSRELSEAKNQEVYHRRELMSAADEMDSLKKRYTKEIADLEFDLRAKDRLLREKEEDLRLCRDDLERERQTVSTLKNNITQHSNAQIALESHNASVLARNQLLQTQLDNARSMGGNLALELERCKTQIAELEQESRDHEGIRRKLHNQIQELKGNIRVFCRVRPILPGEEECADFSYPDRRDHKEIVVACSSESAEGHERKEQYNFTFDQVFEPHTTQQDVFEEISQLTQSCTDGYNVCIFAYGQTGSGKSYTMEGGLSESTMGMIPRAVDQVFRVTEELRVRGWEYTMEGQFLEIYNETINDLLGKADFDKKKHDIRHDPKACSTRVTDVHVEHLTSASQVRALLLSAQSRRSVAATLMNERSSRSHSVFTLRIIGRNTMTGESCEGSLNLVDLAGSERLASSGAGEDKDRLKETQAINKSLSALGDVIAALGEKGEKADKHIPYRNSKLTYLLQYSLSGSSKTLMVLNLSPLASHLSESLTSLRFATKVNNTTIGTAKKTPKS